MDEGEIIVHGHAGDIVGLSARGGRIFVRGDVGYRTGIHMDEFVILCKSKAHAERALRLVTQCIEEDLGLSLNREKTRIATFGKGFNLWPFDCPPSCPIDNFRSV